MNRSALLLLAALALPSPAAAAPGDTVLARFMDAWLRADAQAIARLFTPDSSFVSPWGHHAQGREAIATYYAAAFARGYAGSRGEGHIVYRQALSADLLLVDASFSIDGARKEDGAERPAERGILAAVLRQTADGWRIAALREQESGTALSAFPPPAAQP